MGRFTCNCCCSWTEIEDGFCGVRCESWYCPDCSPRKSEFGLCNTCEEAKNEPTAFALSKLEAIDVQMDAVAAQYERMRSALQAIDNLSYSRGVTMENQYWSLRIPGQSDAIKKVKDALAATPYQSLAAIKAKTLRDLAKQVLPGERADIEPWLLEQADKIEKGS